MMFAVASRPCVALQRETRKATASDELVWNIIFSYSKSGDWLNPKHANKSKQLMGALTLGSTEVSARSSQWPYLHPKLPQREVKYTMRKDWGGREKECYSRKLSALGKIILIVRLYWSNSIMSHVHNKKYSSRGLFLVLQTKAVLYNVLLLGTVSRCVKGRSLNSVLWSYLIFKLENISSV